MNLTVQPVYAKGRKRTARSRRPNAAELRHWDRVRELGCSICGAKNPGIRAR